MPSSATDPGQLLAQLLHRLVDVLRGRDDFTWNLLVALTRGRSGVIDLDGHRLQLRAENQLPYRVDILPADQSQRPHFESTGNAIRDVLRGRITLDKALVEQRILVRAPLQDLLRIYLLVMNILSDSPLDANIRVLFREWELEWPALSAPMQVLALEEQRANHGSLVWGIPRSIRTMDGFVNGSG